MITEAHLPCLYSDEFATDPDAVYAQLRETGPVAWAEFAPGVPGMVITRHQVAIQMLNDEDTFSKDSRLWEAYNAGQVPADSPALALLAWRPSALYADGDDHKRLRRPLTTWLARVSSHRLEETTRTATRSLLDKVDHTGRANLVTDVADSVPLLVFAELMGCPPQMSGRLVYELHGLIEAGERAAEASRNCAMLLAELIELKRREPGDDLTTWMLRHPSGLSDEEIINQLILVVGAGTVPTAAWIVHATRLLLDNDSYAGSLAEGTLTVHRAMEKALWIKSPMAVFGFHYARKDTTLAGVHIPHGVPIGVAYAAANQDPVLPAELDFRNRAHLSWSVGRHQCPATSQATVIARTAIETIWDRLWDMHVTATAEEVPNRHGPFHQCPVSLPVAFAPKTTAADRGPAHTRGA